MKARKNESLFTGITLEVETEEEAIYLWNVLNLPDSRILSKYSRLQVPMWKALDNVFKPSHEKIIL